VTVSGMAVTLNCVLHRGNIGDVDAVIALAESLGIRRVELANVQLYGWAYVNRAALLPTLEQVREAGEAVDRAKARLAGRIEITHVLADYYERYPKPCMDGWARKFMTVAPDGSVFPCPAAAGIRGMRFENVRDRSLGEIWRSSSAFAAYRGTAWMREPCRSCERREIDWGGCRCQAFLMTVDAANTDPACTLSPQHRLIEEAVGARDPSASLIPRRMPRT